MTFMRSAVMRYSIAAAYTEISYAKKTLVALHEILIQVLEFR